ncbi:MAG TPA: PDZ domain-containing protein, partial [Pirellulales bacterium]
MHLIGSISWWLEPAHWLTVLKVAGGLGFVIFVHELGHFLVAKACGVKCEKFYIGFDLYGLKFCKFQWGETEYGIGILPLGGYVKMLGQDDNPARYTEEARRSRQAAEIAAEGADGNSGAGNGTKASALATAEHAPHLTHGDLPSEPVSDPHEPYDPRSYMAQSVPKRMAIISAGVIMNVIFAFFMATLAYRMGVPEAPCVVGGTVVGGAAWKANLQPGDEIVQVGTVEHPRFRDLQTGVTLGDAKSGIAFTVRSGPGEPDQKIVLYPDTSLGVPMIGITSEAAPELINQPEIKPTVRNSPARNAEPKFEPGDRIAKINDMPIANYRDLDRAMVKFQDDPIHVTVERTSSDPEHLAPAKDAHGNPEKPPIKTVEITVQPAPRRDLGLVMSLGPVVAVQANSPAEKAGIKVGDRIVSVNGQPVGKPVTLGEKLRQWAIAGKPVQLEIERTEGDKNTTKIPLTVELRTPTSTDVMIDNSPLPLSPLGVACEVAPVVAAVEPDSAAAKADVQPGDKLVSIKLIPPETPVEKDDDQLPPPKVIPFDKKLSWPGFALADLSLVDPASKFEIEVEREGKTHTIVLTSFELKDADGKVLHTPLRGFRWKQIYNVHQAQSLSEAFRLGLGETKDSLLLVYRIL